MKIVLDTSVIMAVIGNEPEKPALIQLTKGAELIAPHSVHWEIGNALSALVRRKRLSSDEALRALEAYAGISIMFVDIELDLSLNLASELGIYAYDAYLLRCAGKYRTPLLSLDRYLVDCAGKMKIRVIEVR